MATNFKIFIHRNSDHLHVKPVGEFDGSSAHQLINTIAKHSKGTLHIFVHTSHLRSIDPFALDIFHTRLGLACGHIQSNIVYTGTMASTIAPMNGRVIAG